jgi:hypothetical protein
VLILFPNSSARSVRLPHHRGNIEGVARLTNLPNLPQCAGTADAADSTSHIGHEEFQVLLKRGFFNSAPIAHHTILKRDKARTARRQVR